MLSDAHFAESSIPEPERADPRLRPAVVASLLLHAGLALAISRGVVNLADPDAAEPPALTVIIATRSPQSSHAPESTPQNSPEIPSEETAADAPSEPVPPLPASTPAPVALVPAPMPEDSQSSEAAAGAEVVLDMQGLQNSISSYTTTYRSSVIEQAVVECQQHRERYATWDCPRGEEVKSATQELIDENLDATFRAWVSGHDENERITRELLADMAMLRPMLDDKGVLGEVARSQYAVKAAHYLYLNPPQEKSDVVTLIGFSPGGINILNGLITIGSRGLEFQDKGPARPFDEEEK